VVIAAVDQCLPPDLLTCLRGRQGKVETEFAGMGPTYALNKKLDWHIDTWTDKDSEALIACLNWRARWFFL
jgi:hypothetical protein